MTQAAKPLKQKVTFNLPNDLVRAYRLSAVRQGLADQEILEQALREYLGLGALERLQAAFSHQELDDTEAEQLALEAVKETRQTRGLSARAAK